MPNRVRVLFRDVHGVKRGMKRTLSYLTQIWWAHVSHTLPALPTKPLDQIITLYKGLCRQVYGFERGANLVITRERRGIGQQESIFKRTLLGWGVIPQGRIRIPRNLRPTQPGRAIPNQRAFDEILRDIPAEAQWPEEPMQPHVNLGN